jgi:hypothetical protein
LHASAIELNKTSSTLFYNVSITRKTEIIYLKKTIRRIFDDSWSSLKNQINDKLIYENEFFNSDFVNDKVDKVICRIIQLFIINTHDDQKNDDNFVAQQRLVDSQSTTCRQADKHTEKDFYSYSENLCKLSIVFRMNRWQNNVKSSMNLIIIMY